MTIKRITSSLVLIALLTGGLVYVARARRPSAAQASDALLAVAPGDSALVAYVDLAVLRSSPLTSQLVGSTPPVPLDKDYTDFVTATGFDYQRDLDRVLITSRSGAPTDDTLIFAEGRFDRAKIEQYALRSGKQESENGHALFVVPSPGPGKTVRFAFLGGNRMVFSNSGDLSGAFSITPKSFDAAMRERLSRVSGAPVFAVMKASSFMAANPMGGGPGAAAGNAGAGNPLVKGLAAPFAAVQWISLAARPDGEQVMLSVEGECSRPDDAQGVANSLQLLRAILHGALADPKTRNQLPAGSAASIGKVLDTMTITTEESRVRLLVSLMPDMLHWSQPHQPGQAAQPAPLAPAVH